ncbi:hypothetical protein [Sphingomonas carotinifaciens]|uniref:hypothetical protein n=1 Tax=Sphingomonas carotinifaciens TaxID=1166323 RepID=UPI0012372EFD|nr:hypothetical protein [Sphingomonas carotinifaciens]
MITTAWKQGSGSIWHAGMWSLLGALLLTPLIAMQLTQEVRWTGFDFAAAAVLMGTLGVFVEVACRVVIRPLARAAVLAVLLAAALLVWAEGAVGVF